MKKLFFILILLPLFLSGQGTYTGSYIPKFDEPSPFGFHYYELSEWLGLFDTIIADTVYIDPSLSDPNRDYGGRDEISDFNRNTWYLWKRGTTDDFTTGISLNDDHQKRHIKLGVYGSGTDPAFWTTSNDINFVYIKSSYDIQIDSIHMEGATYDRSGTGITISENTALFPRPNSIGITASNITIRNAGVGIDFIAVTGESAEIDSVLVYNGHITKINQDGMFGDCHWLWIEHCKVDSFNGLWYVNFTDLGYHSQDVNGGDGIQFGQLYSFTVIHSLFDGRWAGNKFDILMGHTDHPDSCRTLIDDCEFWSPKDTIAVTVTSRAVGLDDFHPATPYYFPGGSASNPGRQYGDTTWAYVIEIDGVGDPNTFKWSLDGGSTFEATGVPITGSLQTLANTYSAYGLSIDADYDIYFDATTGHTLGDAWDMRCSSNEDDEGGSCIGIASSAVGQITNNRFHGTDFKPPTISCSAFGTMQVDTLVFDHNFGDSLQGPNWSDATTGRTNPYTQYTNNTIIRECLTRYSPSSHSYVDNAIFGGQGPVKEKNNIWALLNGDPNYYGFTSYDSSNSYRTKMPEGLWDGAFGFKDHSTDEGALDAGSILIDDGADISSYFYTATKDIDGNDIDASIDIGAFEYVAPAGGSLDSPIITSKDSTKTSFTFNWSAVTGATGYQYETALNNDFGKIFKQDSVYTTNTYCTVTDILPGNLMYFRVRAVNATDTSSNTADSVMTDYDVRRYLYVNNHRTRRINYITDPIRVNNVATSEASGYIYNDTDQASNGIILSCDTSGMRPQQFTILSRILFDNTTSEETLGILGNYNTVSTSGFGFYYYTGNSKLGVTYGNLEGHGVKYPSGTTPSEVWVTVGVTYDNSDSSYSFYSQGSSIGSGVFNYSISWPDDANTSLLDLYSNYNGHFFTGKADWIWYSNDVISADSMEAYTASGTNPGINYTNLIDYWDISCDDVYPTILSATGNHNGTFSGTNASKSNLQCGSVGSNYSNKHYISLGGTDELINSTEYTPYNFGADGDFAISLWFRTSTSQYANLVSKYKGADHSGWRFAFYTTGKLYLILGDGSEVSDYTTTDNLYDGKWHFAAINCDRSGNANFYIDGNVPDATTIDITSIGAGFDNTNTMAVSSQFGTSAVQCFTGDMDEIAIYKRLLTTDEIGKLYGDGINGNDNDFNPASLAGIITLYNFEKDAFPTITNLVGTDGTAENMDETNIKQY